MRRIHRHAQVRDGVEGVDDADVVELTPEEVEAERKKSLEKLQGEFTDEAFALNEKYNVKMRELGFDPHVESLN